MNERILLIDSDIFVLLSAAGVLDDLIECLGFKQSNVRRLAALVDRPASNAHWEALLSVDQIDEGEASLFAKLAEGNASLLATGDQRSLIALGNSDQLSLFRKEIRGRVICLESALLRLVYSLGAEVVGEAFQPLRGIDAKIDIFFGHKTEFITEEVVRQLSSYLNALHANNPRVCPLPSTGSLYRTVPRSAMPQTPASVATATAARTTPINSPPRQLTLLMAQCNKSRRVWGASPLHPFK